MTTRLHSKRNAARFADIRDIGARVFGALVAPAASKALVAWTYCDYVESMLLDHFHSPLKDIRPWTGFHGLWAGKLASAIGRRLPDGWFAAPTVHWDIEIDVAAFQQGGRPHAVGRGDPPLVIPEPTKTIAFAFTTDVVEVQVFHDLGELMLAGAIEFISPANKDRPENREAFVAKCDALLRDEVGLVLVDIVTSRRTNLHADLMERLGEPADADDDLYLAAYRPLTGASGPALSIWYRSLRLGAEIPPALLFLKDGPIVEVPLKETYRDTCTDLKIPLPGA
ncbi:MAG: DUF4058 family protein [Planctomycetes bacterium]|nr:DUF4058 family protein [Planctomycetota bacterium]